jgi:hypothetical protein
MREVVKKTPQNSFNALSETMVVFSGKVAAMVFKTYNTLVAYEIFHYFNQSSSKKGYIGIKTDMSMAYDRVEWIFLQSTLEAWGSPSTSLTLS